MTDRTSHAAESAARAMARIPRLDPVWLQVLRSKTAAEKLAMAFDTNRLVRLRLEAHVRDRHPDWDEQAIRREVARRMLGGTS